MKKIEVYLETCSDEELRQFITRCEQKFYAHADIEVRRMAGKTLKMVREEQTVRDLLRR